MCRQIKTYKKFSCDWRRNRISIIEKTTGEHRIGPAMQLAVTAAIRLLASRPVSAGVQTPLRGRRRCESDRCRSSSLAGRELPWPGPDLLPSTTSRAIYDQRPRVNYT